LVVVLVPDDTPENSLTWIGVSADEALLTKKLAAIVAGTSSSLGSRPDLESLKAGPAIAAGFFPESESATAANIPYSATMTETGASATLEVAFEMSTTTFVQQVKSLIDEF
jgi:hypothetical protein